MSEPIPNYEVKREPIMPVYSAMISRAERWRQICTLAGFGDRVDEVSPALVLVSIGSAIQEEMEAVS